MSKAKFTSVVDGWTFRVRPASRGVGIEAVAVTDHGGPGVVWYIEGGVLTVRDPEEYDCTGIYDVPLAVIDKLREFERAK